YRQLSQEIRIASSEEQTVSYLGGIFFQHSALDFEDEIQVPTDSVIPIALSSSFGPAANLLKGAITARNFNQDTDLGAIFAQLTWNYTDSSRVILGARYTREKKDAERHQYHLSGAGEAL